MNLRTLDLNLLVVFDAVMNGRSVTQAAAELNMTQPAVSQALARLRLALGDDIFVRTPAGMVPTLKAESLAEGVQTALEELRRALDNAEPFAPASAECRFIIAVNNHAALVLADRLAAAAAAEAPGVLLDFRPSGTLDLADRLDRRDLDLVIGNSAAPGDRFSDVLLYSDHYVALMRRGHPAAAPGALTMAAFAALPHIEISSSGKGLAFVDERLAEQKLVRHIVLRMPLLGVPSALAHSDMITIMSQRAAQELARLMPLTSVPLPIASPRVVSAMLWHRRLTHAPSHCWLRQFVTRIARASPDWLRLHDREQGPRYA